MHRIEYWREAGDFQCATSAIHPACTRSERRSTASSGRASVISAVRCSRLAAAAAELEIFKSGRSLRVLAHSYELCCESPGIHLQQAAVFLKHHVHCDSYIAVLCRVPRSTGDNRCRSTAVARSARTLHRTCSHISNRRNCGEDST